MESRWSGRWQPFSFSCTCTTYRRKWKRPALPEDSLWRTSCTPTTFSLRPTAGPRSDVQECVVGMTDVWPSRSALLRRCSRPHVVVTLLWWRQRTPDNHPLAPRCTGLQVGPLWSFPSAVVVNLIWWQPSPRSLVSSVIKHYHLKSS